MCQNVTCFDVINNSYLFKKFDMKGKPSSKFPRLQGKRMILNKEICHISNLINFMVSLSNYSYFQKENFRAFSNRFWYDFVEHLPKFFGHAVVGFTHYRRVRYCVQKSGQKQ